MCGPKSGLDPVFIRDSWFLAAGSLLSNKQREKIWGQWRRRHRTPLVSFVGLCCLKDLVPFIAVGAPLCQDQWNNARVASAAHRVLSF